MEEDYMDDGPYSTRNQNGVITYFDKLEDAMNDFMGYDGYRISIKLDSSTIYIHRDELPMIPKAKPGSLAYDNPSARNTYEAKVIVERS